MSEPHTPEEQQDFNNQHPSSAPAEPGAPVTPAAEPTVQRQRTGVGRILAAVGVAAVLLVGGGAIGYAIGHTTAEHHHHHQVSAEKRTGGHKGEHKGNENHANKKHEGRQHPKQQSPSTPSSTAQPSS